jgi:hypothetical protein
MLPDSLARGVVPPGVHLNGVRSPVIWVLLCPPCAGYAPTTDPGYCGHLSGQCRGCGLSSRELHRFGAWINTEAGCSCTGVAADCSCADRHERVFGDVGTGGDPGQD